MRYRYRYMLYFSLKCNILFYWLNSFVFGNWKFFIYFLCIFDICDFLSIFLYLSIRSYLFEYVVFGFD